jgi:hypothetical protein
MDDPSIDMLIENEDYLMLRELQIRQWKLRPDNFPKLEYKPSFVGSLHDLGNKDSQRDKDSQKDKGDSQHLHNQSPILEKMGDHVEEYFFQSQEAGSMKGDISLGVNLEENLERNVNDLTKNMETIDQCETQKWCASQQDSFLEERDKDPTLDLETEDITLKKEDRKVDPNLTKGKDTDLGQGEDFDEDLLKYDVLHENDIRVNALPDLNLPVSYSFLKDIQLKKYDKLTYSNVNVKTERGNIKPVKALYSKEQVDLIMDLGNNTHLERFQLGKEIIHNITSENHRFLLPKTRALIIAETGVRSACLYESLSEWLLEEEGHFSIAPLPFYYREWYDIYGKEYRKRKLTHNIDKKSPLALQLRDAINTEIVDNADALFRTFPKQILGDDYKNANSLRHGADFKRNQDHMGGLAQIVMFSVMTKTPILVWEHDDESSFWLSSMITGSVTEWNNFTVNERHVIPNPHNIIIHLLYNRRASQALSHYEVLVVFNDM